MKHESLDMITKPMNPSREKLYEGIWTEPITRVAKRHGVSDSYLVRILQRLNIPRPPMGYWVKLANGKIVPKPPLPEAGPGDELEWTREGQPKRVPRALPRPPDPANLSRRRKKADRPMQHALITEARKHFENADETESGYLKPAKKLMADLIVSKTSLERAMEMANDLFLILEDRDHHVMIASSGQNFVRADFDEREAPSSNMHYPRLWHPYRPTIVFVGTVAIGLTLFEMTEEAEAKWVDGKYVRLSAPPVTGRKSVAYSSGWTSRHDFTSGRLCLQAYSPYYDTSWKQQWRESGSGDLKSKLKTIVRELTNAATVIAREAAEAAQRAEVRRREWDAQHERWKHEQEEQRRKKAIKESREELHAIIDSWNEMKKIESFFREAEQLAMNLSPEEQSYLMNRLKEAKAQISGPDALQRILAWKSAEERLND